MKNEKPQILSYYQTTFLALIAFAVLYFLLVSTGPFEASSEKTVVGLLGEKSLSEVLGSDNLGGEMMLHSCDFTLQEKAGNNPMMYHFYSKSIFDAEKMCSELQYDGSYKVVYFLEEEKNQRIVSDIQLLSFP